MAKLTTIKNIIIAPFILSIIFFAAFQSNREWSDLIALFICGTLGIYMKRFGWSRPGLIIGFILASKVESSIYKTIQAYGLSFLQRPASIVLVIFIAFSIIAAARFKTHLENMSESGPYTHKGKWKQIIFYY